MALNKKTEEVFQRAKKIRGMDSEKYRQDDCGNVLFKHSYGKHTPMGWEKDHIIPKSLGGSDKVENLRVLKTKTNRSRGNRDLKCS
jgi:5-methylcytosine-specific restriction endonuclease McrA